MTKYELMVIAAAAAAFVVINIIMWSIIAAKEKKAKRNEEQSAPQPEQPDLGINTPAPATMKREKIMPEQAVPTIKPETVRHEKRSDFVLLDDIVITHTDERI